MLLAIECIYNVFDAIVCGGVAMQDARRGGNSPGALILLDVGTAFHNARNQDAIGDSISFPVSKYRPHGCIEFF